MKPQKFPPTSRYFGMETRRMTLSDGREVVYLSRRFVPPPENFATLGSRVVVGGDRPDLLAFEVIGDPEQFWKIADANALLHPDELTEVPGHVIRITLPEGVPTPEEVDQ